MANPYGLFSDFECWDDFMGLSGGSEPNEGGRVPGPAHPIFLLQKLNINNLKNLH